MVEKIFTAVAVATRAIMGIALIILSILVQFSVVSAAMDGWFDVADQEIAMFALFLPLVGVAFGVTILATVPSMLRSSLTFNRKEGL